ncbi:hypothetical protein [Streptomyces capitiformicae]|uniref:Uncharacterized protein n=1 Tax=Streptomyces capitiformicae TaxID=2014920 RepID=A0A918Z3N6_9ACTN|nr:hypothetical protein [Streptomyces capitiformicae]GHE32801.1 hypothetical protein GCM10017771_49640 [Streptomyces capitiformicae]
MRRVTSGVLTLALAGSGMVAAAAPSYAACAPEKPVYNITNIKRIDK